MTKPPIATCCFIKESSAKAEADISSHHTSAPCQATAEWSILASGASSADIEYACTEHVGHMLGDASGYTVTHMRFDG